MLFLISSICVLVLSLTVLPSELVKYCCDLRISAKDWSNFARKTRSALGSAVNLLAMFSPAMSKSAIDWAFQCFENSVSSSPKTFDIRFHSRSPSLNCGPLLRPLRRLCCLAMAFSQSTFSESLKCLSLLFR